MEAGVAKLEAHIEHIRSDINEMPVLISACSLEH
jgi:hypothetical protein